MTLSELVTRATQAGVSNVEQLQVVLRVGVIEQTLGDFDLKISKGQLVLVGRAPRKRASRSVAQRIEDMRTEREADSGKD